MPRGRAAEGQVALTNAERQARYRATVGTSTARSSSNHPRPQAAKPIEALE